MEPVRGASATRLTKSSSSSSSSPLYEEYHSRYGVDDDADDTAVWSAEMQPMKSKTPDSRTQQSSTGPGYTAVPVDDAPGSSSSKRSRIGIVSSRWSGWRSGVLTGMCAVAGVLLLNIAFTIWASTTAHEGVLMEGSCSRARYANAGIHVLINVLSTLLLGASNYAAQVASSPTREDVDKAHSRRRWLDVGVPSVRNLFGIGGRRVALWVLLGLSSVPLHLLYNSATFYSISANNYMVFEVAGNWRTGKMDVDAVWSKISIGVDDPTSEEIAPLLASAVNDTSNSNNTWTRLEPVECIKAYGSSFVSTYRTVVLVANETDTTNVVLEIDYINSSGTGVYEWVCPLSLAEKRLAASDSGTCAVDSLADSVASGKPWEVWNRTVTECYAEKTGDHCKLQFSQTIMIVVILCNALKLVAMLLVVREVKIQPLATLGDAISSFLTCPDETTRNMCYAGKKVVEKEWTRGFGGGARTWKSVRYRWWNAPSKTRWIVANGLCILVLLIAAYLLRLGLKHDGMYDSINIGSLFERFGQVNQLSLYAPNGSTQWGSVTANIVLANTPQLVLSGIYLTYNSLFTCMLVSLEWARYSIKRAPLRVTRPQGSQRSTYYLQIPYRYGIPLMVLSGVLHWIISQSIFLARIELHDAVTGLIVETISTCGYSCAPIIIGIVLGGIAIVGAALVGSIRYPYGTVLAASCSAAISAACHGNGGVSELGAAQKPVMWGASPWSAGVGHLGFSAEEVGRPVVGYMYAGGGAAEAARKRQ